MKDFKAQLFNKKASDPRNKADEIIEAIGLKSGQNIADIGSGGGYFSLRFAEIIGKTGKVYAVDTNTDFLKFINDRAKEKGLNNIITLLIEDKLTLPENSLNYVFMRNVTHHLPNRVEYFKNLKKFLRQNGRIIIIEYKKDKIFSFHGLFGHYVSKETIIREMKDAGYLFEKEVDFLPEQHFTMYVIQPETMNRI